MAGIQDYLNLIKTAIYGKDVRQAIHDGIQQCYYDGKAGAIDLEARQRIDQIVAPSGEAPSAAEVADGRIVDGVTYNLIGDAIRAVNDNSKSDLKNSAVQLGNGKIIETGYVWEHGEISSSTGGDVYSANPLRTKGYYSTADVDYIELTDSSQSVRIYYYTDNTGTYDGTDAIDTLGILLVDKTNPYYRLKIVNDDYSLVSNANSVLGYAIASFQTSIEYLFASSEEAEKVTDEVFPLIAEISVGDTTNSYRLKPDGYGAVDASYKLLKYAVVGGSKIRVLNSDHLFQFQSAPQVYTSGTSYRIGETYGIGNYILNVPSTATHLIVSTKIDIDNVHIYSANDRINEIENIIDDNFVDETQTLYGTTSNAYINSSGVITPYSGNERVLEVNVLGGEKLKINAWAYNANYFFTYYDTDDILLGGYKNSSGNEAAISNYEIIVPTNATKIAISGSILHSPAPSGSKTTKVNPNTFKWAGKKWAMVGDSLTASPSTKTTKYYFDYIAEETGITTYNMGVSGSGYRAETDHPDSAFYKRISNVPADSDVVTIFGSFNDGLTDLGTATDSGTTTVGGCINTTIDNLYAVFPTVQLGIISPTPWVGANPYNHSEANAYADLLEAICKRRSIPFLNLYYESNLRPWDATFRSLAYTKDDGNGVHPDETGHKIIASRFLGFLDSLLT